MSGGYENKKPVTSEELTAAEELWVQTGNAGILLLAEQGSSPSPTSGIGKLFVKSSDSQLYFLDDLGVEHALGAAAGANVAFEYVTAVQSGADITLDLTTLAHTFATILGVSRSGPILPTRSDVWARVLNTITYLNADASEVFAVLYTY